MTESFGSEGQAVVDLHGERPVGLFDVLDVCCRAGSAREILEAVIGAVAGGYGADVRAYRQDATGAFVLELWRAAGNPAGMTRRLAGHPAFELDDVCLLELRELKDIGWAARDSGRQALFAPVMVDDSTEWLVAVVDGIDPSIASTLRLLRRTTGAALVALDRQAEERLRRRTIQLLTPGIAPFDATARLVLDAISAAIGASSGQLVIGENDHSFPIVSVASGVADASPVPVLDQGGTNGHEVAFHLPAGARLTATFRFRRQSGTFSAAAVRLVGAAGGLVASWLAGVFLRRDPLRPPTVSDTSADLVKRLRSRLDGSGCVALDGALAVLLPESPCLGSEVDDLVKIVQDQVRPSDLTGIVADAGAGVLLPGVTGESAQGILERLLGAALKHRLGLVRVSIITFTGSSITPEALLERALASAWQPPDVL